ncbi:hypothetical protein MMC21_007062 [Puttea exsequens]|nr:hypothetical protein [Puttea exsequens]
MLQGDTGPSQPATFSSRSPESTGSVSITLDDSNQQWGTLPASLTSLAAVAKSFTETIGPTTIVPDYTVTNAFPAGITQTTLRESNGAILIYSISTFADQATITGAPIPIWTTVDQTDSNGHHTRFVGLIWVGAGGRYWGPPGIPKIEIGGGPHFHHIKPLCLAPFCSGKESENGVGGGAPGGTSPPAEETPEEEEENEREEEEEEEEKTKEEQKTEEKQTKSKEEKTETEEGQTKTEDKQTSTELGKSSAIYSSTISVSAVHSSTASVSANGTITLLDGDFTYSLMPYTEALEYASSAQALIDGISIPDGPLWVPTGSEELALTATASDSDGDFPWPGFIIPPGRNRLSTITSAISLSSATVKNTVATATRDSTHSSFLTGTRATGDLSLPISTAKTLATTGRDSTHHSFSNSATAKTITKAGLSLLSGDDFPTLDIHLYKPIPVGRSVLTLEPYTPPAPAPTPAPPPSPPPPPPPTPSVAVLMWREDSCGDLASGCDSAVRVYDIPAADQSMNPCKPSDYTVIYKVVYKSYVGNDESDYVITVGPFTTHGVKGVRYSGSNLHVGRLTGDGLPGGVVQCGESSRDVVSCSSSHSLDQDDMIPVFYCEW